MYSFLMIANEFRLSNWVMKVLEPYLRAAETRIVAEFAKIRGGGYNSVLYLLKAVFRIFSIFFEAAG